MVSLFTMLFFYLPMVLKTNTEIIQPNSSSMLYGGEYYNVKWNTTNNVNLQFQIYNDTQQNWVSHVNDNHFLSIVIDQSTDHYNWSVPLYLSQYWQNPTRMVLNSLDTPQTYISEEFSIAGIYVNLSLMEDTNILFMNDNITITWQTNTDSDIFNVSVYDNTTNYNNIKYKEPLYPICTNIGTNASSLCSWNNINQTGTFVIGVTSDRLYGMTTQFHVYYTPTLAPTASPTQTPTWRPSKSPIPAPTNQPTREITDTPSQSPTIDPTKQPTCSPTQTPSQPPSYNPTQSPSQSPAQVLVDKNNDNSDEVDSTVIWVIIGCIIGIIFLTLCCSYYCIDYNFNQTTPSDQLRSATNVIYNKHSKPLGNTSFYSSSNIPKQNDSNNRKSIYPNLDLPAGVDVEIKM